MSPVTCAPGTFLYSILIGLCLASLASPARAQTQAQPNLALNRPVISSGANFGSFRPSALTDGTVNSFTSPAAASGTKGFYYQVDLGRSYRLDRIILRNRGDGCCPERLSRIRVELYGDGGDVTGRLQWSANIREDGSNSGVNGIDVITATNQPDGNFAGRYIRVVNDSGLGYSPQLSEIEAYGGLAPVIRSFAADNDNLPGGQAATLRWLIDYATSAVIREYGPVAHTNGLLSVLPSATTSYTLSASNELGVVSRTIAVGVDAILAPPVISEFLAENGSGFEDEDGDPSDWIEIQNPNPFSLPLEGMRLTDRPDRQGGAWIFPAVRMPPNGFLVVFASGKDRRDPANPLHTDFKIDSKGESLALIGRDGRTVLQRYPADFPITAAIPQQHNNVSYGIGSSGAIGFMRPATPGAANGPAFAGVVADTKFSPDRGFYDTNFLVAITCATPDAVIRYTTNRSAPSATSGLIYRSAIPITRTTVLRAAAFKDGWVSTDVDTHSYIFPSNVIASPLMRASITTSPAYRPKMRDALLDLPSIALVSSASIPDTAEVKTSFEWIDPRSTNGVHVDCGARLFGGAFTDFAKKSFRLTFKSEFGPPKLHYPVFEGFGRDLAPATSFDQLELRNGSHDMEMRGFYMSNLFSDDTLLDLGQLAPHGRFVHVYLNGDYWGVYHLRERWGASMHRSYLGGSVTNYESINGNWNVGGWAEPGTPYDGDGSTWARVKQLKNNFPSVRRILDVPNYIDYMLTWIWGRCEDEYRAVGPNTTGSGFKFYINDADGFFQSPANPWYGEPSNRTQHGAQGRQPGDGPGNLFSSLLNNGGLDYRVLLADRIHRAVFNDGPLTPARSAKRLLDRCAEVELAFLAEAARWNYRTPVKWASIRDDVVTNWIPTRTAEVLRQLRSSGFYPSLDAPSLNIQGGVVARDFQPVFTGPQSSAIYFTVDGTDPRLPGGGISPSAKRTILGGTSEILVPAGARWRWFTDAAGLGASDIVAGHPQWSAANWKHPVFSDASWSSGPAQLGYGEGDEATVIPYGPDANNKWTTSYFRTAFVLPTLSGIRLLQIRLKQDDGAIVYLNGVEVIRSAIKAGVADGSTKSDASPDDGQAFANFETSTSMLRVGTNIIAVELHQATANTSDASFDLELAALRSGGSSGEIPLITSNTVLKSRAFNGALWSAMNEAFFQVRPEPVLTGEVVISEIHFHPSGTGDSEFLELANVSGHAINLRSARFAKGIDFDFPRERDTLLSPGGRLVLVRNLFQFQQRYGIEVPVGGIYRGNLNNGGERILLEFAPGRSLASVDYKPVAPWPAQTDGEGFSLVLAHPGPEAEQPGAWRRSIAIGGTPGGTDARLFVGNPTADADGDGFSDLLEHALGTQGEDPRSGPGAITYGYDPGGRFFIQFQRNLAADDTALTVDYSRDLSTWTLANPLATEPAPEPGISMERWGLPVLSEQAVFLRLRVARLR